MKTALKRHVLFLALLGQALPAFAQGSAFTYQGRLSNSGGPANGAYAMQFTLKDAAAGGSSIGVPVAIAPLAVSNGLFTATLDFGGAAFTGAARWLEIGVRTNGSVAAYTVLTPRQALTPTPYAMLAGTAASVPAANISGTVSTSQLPANVARLDVNETFTGQVNFNGASVGIGTTTPRGTLEAGAGPQWSSHNFGANLVLSGWRNNAIGLLDMSSTNPWAIANMSGTFSVAQMPPLGNTTTAPDYRLSIASNGNVGIGTASPSRKLEIAGNNVALKLTDTSGSGSSWLFALGVIGGDGQFALYDSTAGAHRLVIDRSGYVGIGTTRPANQFHVAGGDFNARFGPAVVSGGGGSITGVEVLGQRPDGNQTFGGRIGLSLWRTDAKVANYTMLGQVRFGGNHTDTSLTNLAYGASILGMSEGNFNSRTDMPIGIGFYTGSTGVGLTEVNNFAGVERMRISSSGNIGIGTGTPAAKLDVSGSIRSSVDADEGGTIHLVNPRKTGNAAAGEWALYNMTGGYGDSLQFWSYQGSWFDWGPRFILKDDGTTVLAPRGGNVGIGTASPTDSILDVEGNMHLNDYDLFLRAGVDRNHGLGWYGPGKLFAGFGFDGPVLYGFGGGGLGTVGVGGSQNVALNWNGQGNVGIGTTPQGVLDVSGAACRVVVSAPKPLLVTGTDNGGAIYFGAPGSEGNAATAAIEASWGNIWNPRVSIGVVRDGARANILMDYLGHTYIRNGSNTIVYVGGDNQVSISGSLTTSGTTTTRVLEITGGADVAEPFNVNHPDKPDPGMVVAIDRQHPGELHIADQAYDKTVAGIISGANGVNPGLTLKQKGTSADGDQPVALSGRVYCLCDASYGPIEPGDLLTSSATPGHAMAVKDHTRAQGAIIGKAMATLTEGKGLVLVLVTLQ